MRIVGKYILHITKQQFLDLPIDVTPKYLGFKDGVVNFWAEISPEFPKEQYEIRCKSTGEQIDDVEGWTYLGTIWTPVGNVYHYYMQSTGKKVGG